MVPISPSLPIVHRIVGFNSGIDRFFTFILLICVQSIVGVYLGMSISAVASSPEQAFVIGPPIMITLVLFSGFYINVCTLLKARASRPSIEMRLMTSYWYRWTICPWEQDGYLTARSLSGPLKH